ncbi:MAG TPA: hypothetical protein VG123_32430 [Streptosporangiaceae bacterium]|nr:hypothetical protein [Streptosporangiaceae bacterium]
MGEDVGRAGGVAAAGGVAGEPAGDDRVGVVVPSVQHDVGDGDAERGDGRELSARPARAAGERARGSALPCSRVIPASVPGGTPVAVLSAARSGSSSWCSHGLPVRWSPLTRSQSMPAKSKMSRTVTCSR